MRRLIQAGFEITLYPARLERDNAARVNFLDTTSYMIESFFFRFSFCTDSEPILLLLPEFQQRSMPPTDLTACESYSTPPFPATSPTRTPRA